MVSKSAHTRTHSQTGCSQRICIDFVRVHDESFACTVRQGMGRFCGEATYSPTFSRGTVHSSELRMSVYLLCSLFLLWIFVSKSDVHRPVTHKSKLSVQLPSVHYLFMESEKTLDILRCEAYIPFFLLGVVFRLHA